MKFEKNQREQHNVKISMGNRQNVRKFYTIITMPAFAKPIAICQPKNPCFSIKKIRLKRNNRMEGEDNFGRRRVSRDEDEKEVCQNNK